MITAGALLHTSYAQESQSANTSTYRATHYGISYQGQTMGCGGRYDTNNPAILAVGPPLYASTPCGTQFQITGPAGTIIVQRTDSCPGCSNQLIDLSEAGITQVCGSLGSCVVTMERLEN